MSVTKPTSVSNAFSRKARHLNQTCSSVALIALLALHGPVYASPDVKDSGVVELREDIGVKTDETVRLTNSEFNRAAAAFEKGASDLTVLMNEHANCRSKAFESEGNTQSQTTRLLDCSVEHALGNGKVLDRLKETSIEVANGIDQVALRFGELERSSNAEIADKREIQNKLEGDIRELQVEGRAIGEWLKANPDTEDAEQLLNMRDIYLRMQHLKDRIASMERRIMAQKLGSERFNALQKEIQLEAMQTRQMGKELGYKAAAERDYAVEVRETGVMNAAFAQTQGLFETTASLLNSFGKVKDILDDAEARRPNPILMPSSPSPSVRERLVRDEEIFAFFLDLVDAEPEVGQ